MKFIPTQLKAWQRDPAAFIETQLIDLLSGRAPAPAAWRYWQQCGGLPCYLSSLLLAALGARVHTTC